MVVAVVWWRNLLERNLACGGVDSSGRAASLLAGIVWHSETPSNSFCRYLFEGTIIYFS
jgi:hypothetical protein